MKRVPRGYPADHPRAGLLKHRSLIAARELESEAVRDVEPVYRACERLRPLVDWLARHVVAAPQEAAAAAIPDTLGRRLAAEDLVRQFPASPSISNGARYAAAGLSIIVALAAMDLTHDQRARAINHAQLA